MRRLARTFALPGLVAASLAMGHAALAQTWPARPINMIVPFAPGGATDVLARAVAPLMAREIGGSIVIENRPGANSVVGAQVAARAPADAHHFFMTSLGTHSVNPHLLKNPGYSLADFAPVGFLVGTYPVLMTATGNPAQDLKGVLAHAAARPDGLNFAAPNTSSRVAAAMFGLRSGTRVVTVNFTSGPQGHGEVATGRVDYIFGDFATGGALLEGRRLKPLAVAGPRRLTAHPELPTLAEAGLPGVEVEIWTGLFARAGTPDAVVRRMNAALNRAILDPGLADLVKKSAVETRPMSVEQFADYVDGQYRHWGAMVKALNWQPE